MPDSNPIDTEAHHPDQTEYTFDVVISIPEWMEKSVLEERAKEGLGATPEMLERIMGSLASHRVLKIKTDVLRAEADKTAKKFESVGFRAEVTHSLKLKKVSHKTKAKGSDTDPGKTFCPACDTNVVPLAETQCPNCGVYIKKLTPEFLHRKELLRKERERAENILREQKRIEQFELKAELERQIYAKVQAEFLARLKKENGPFARLPSIGWSVLIVIGLVITFFGGRLLSLELPNKRQTNSTLSTKSDSGDDDIQKIIKETNRLQRAMIKMSGTVAQEDAPGVVVMVDPKDSLLFLPETTNATNASTTVTNPSAPIGEKANASTTNLPALSAEVKREVSNALMLTLAESGQIERARELIERAITINKTSADLKLVTRLRVIQVSIEAWALVYGHSEKPQEKIDALAKMLLDVPDAGERASASAAIAAIVLRRSDLNIQAVDPLFNLADESYKSLKVKNPKIGHELLVSRGKAILHNAQNQIARGRLQSAANLIGQLDTMTRIAPEMPALILYGYEQQLSRMIGNFEGAQKRLESALIKIIKIPSLQQEVVILRSLADADGAYKDSSLQTTLSTLVASAEKKGGEDYAVVLLETGLIHAENGGEIALEATQLKLAMLAQSNPTLLPYAERLRGLSEVALAWRAKKTGNFAATEKHLRQAAAMSN